MIGEDCFVSMALISLYFQINSITGLSSLLMRVDVNPKLYVIISCSPRYAAASHLVPFFVLFRGDRAKQQLCTPMNRINKQVIKYFILISREKVSPGVAWCVRTTS